MKMNVEEIKKYLPHRYPFLLLDRVEELVVKSHIIAYKNVTYNEPCFKGHFPHVSIMPGVLTLEAMVQAAGVLSAKTLEQKADGNRIYLFIAADKVRYKRPVFPGDCLRFEVNILKIKQGIWKYQGVTKVQNNLACEAIIYCKEEEKDDLLTSS